MVTFEHMHAMYAIRHDMIHYVLSAIIHVAAYRWHRFKLNRLELIITITLVSWFAIEIFQFPSQRNKYALDTPK